MRFSKTNDRVFRGTYGQLGLRTPAAYAGMHQTRAWFSRACGAVRAGRRAPGFWQMCFVVLCFPDEVQPFTTGSPKHASPLETLA